MAGKAGGDGARLRYCRGLCCKKEKLEFLGTVAVGRGGGEVSVGIRGLAVEIVNPQNSGPHFR